MDINTKEQKRLSQAELLREISRERRLAELITVFYSDYTTDHNYGFYCALIPSDMIGASLQRSSWDLTHGGGYPGAVKYSGDQGEQVEYFRFGDTTGIEPLVIDREFHGIREDYKEISEEFRLFHRLHHDRKTDQYYKIDDAGNEELIAVVERRRIQIRLKEIRQFLAIKEMHLSIQFDCREHSKLSLEDLDLKPGGTDTCAGLLCYSLHYGDLHASEKKGFSRLLGKRAIPPLAKEKSGLWGFAEEEPEQDVDFIIDIDNDGKEIIHSSNPHSGDYLTPVHFRKQVLDKYYHQPNKFSVEDSILRCGYLWSVTIDNHHDDRVCVWLGDLGRDLPYEEQLHWRSHNVPPSGSVSETFYRRQILAEFTDSDRAEHRFRERYDDLARACDEKLGWQILLPLGSADGHYFQSLRVPSTDEQKDFDDLVLAIAKIVIDSLNEKALNTLIPPAVGSEIKGSVSRLERALIEKQIHGYEEHISFMRKLQQLRSAGSAHRKGTNYAKIAEEFALESQNLRTVFAGIMEKALALLDFFLGVVESGALKGAAED